MVTRKLKPGFFKNESLAELPFETRLLFAGLSLLANCRGQLQDRPKRIHADLFPYDHSLDVDRMLQDLSDHDFIYRYILNGASYLQIAKFHLHQSPHPDESDQGIPQFPINLADSKACREFSRQSRNVPTGTCGSAASCICSLSLNLGSDLNAQPANGTGEQTALAPPENAKPAKDILTIQRLWFVEFWNLYWRKVGKKPAWESFKKRVATEAMWLKVRDAVIKQSPQMLARDAERRPHAITWLNQERWNDEDDPAQVGNCYKSQADLIREQAIRGEV